MGKYRYSKQFFEQWEKAGYTPPPRECDEYAQDALKLLCTRASDAEHAANQLRSLLQARDPKTKLPLLDPQLRSGRTLLETCAIHNAFWALAPLQEAYGRGFTQEELNNATFTGCTYQSVETLDVLFGMGAQCEVGSYTYSIIPYNNAKLLDVFYAHHPEYFTLSQMHMLLREAVINSSAVSARWLLEKAPSLLCYAPEQRIIEKLCAQSNEEMPAHLEILQAFLEYPRPESCRLGDLLATAILHQNYGMASVIVQQPDFDFATDRIAMNETLTTRPAIELLLEKAPTTHNVEAYIGLMECLLEAGEAPSAAMFSALCEAAQLCDSKKDGTLLRSFKTVCEEYAFPPFDADHNPLKTLSVALPEVDGELALEKLISDPNPEAYLHPDIRPITRESVLQYALGKFVLTHYEMAAEVIEQSLEERLAAGDTVLAPHELQALYELENYITEGIIVPLLREPVFRSPSAARDAYASAKTLPETWQQENSLLIQSLQQRVTNHTERLANNTAWGAQR